MWNALSFFEPWPAHLRRAVSCDERGLVIGAGTRLVRMTDRGLAVEPDAARCIALLSVLAGRPVGAALLGPIEAAAAYWAAGDKALANLRLAFSGLPTLGSESDAHRIDAAAWCLDQGLTPRELMKALDLDPSALHLRKFDRDQPRVPAGSGRESGRWTDGTGDGQPDRRFVTSSKLGPIRVAANGPIKPDGVEVTRQPADPLDPLSLNKSPPTLDKQQAIANALNIIINGAPEELKRLQPHPYQNLPENPLALYFRQIQVDMLRTICSLMIEDKPGSLLIELRMAPITQTIITRVFTVWISTGESEAGELNAQH